ncbi:very-short-patch-repair endonuclease [Bosea psychrotolerans]|uniref:Very-short-patch-repair endonuclease n=1 Tax=Bosea psychrotolerans TaxID=1871628 RepID=A0A2S4MC75_9HYPH|nr:very-short-patch-repair endonuclease [Bosea psychrotolerans]
MNRQPAPSPLAGEGWGEGARDGHRAATAKSQPGNVTAPPHPAAARPPSPARGEGENAATLSQTLRGRARAMRKEPTEAERKLWHLVRDRRFSGFKFRRQVPIGRYIVDLVCLEKRLIVEADGGQHAENAHDVVRDAWLAVQGFRIRRFWNADILQRPDEVRDTLWHDLDGVARIEPTETAEMRS